MSHKRLNREADIIMLLNAILPVWLQQLGSIKNQTEDAVHQIADNVATLVKRLDQTDGISEQAIRSDVEKLMLVLQYQDRINQTLSVVINDINRLHDNMSANIAELPSPEDWLNELSSRYTMHDERSHHHQAVDKRNSSNAKPDSDEVIFF